MVCKLGQALLNFFANNLKPIRDRNGNEDVGTRITIPLSVLRRYSANTSQPTQETNFSEQKNIVLEANDIIAMIEHAWEMASVYEVEIGHKKLKLTCIEKGGVTRYMMA